MNKTAAERVALARSPDRPRIHDYISALFTNFFETHGDRLSGDDSAMLCGIALFEGAPVTVAGTVKGTDINKNIAANFGMASPASFKGRLPKRKSSGGLS